MIRSNRPRGPAAAAQSFTAAPQASSAPTPINTMGGPPAPAIKNPAQSFAPRPSMPPPMAQNPTMPAATAKLNTSVAPPRTHDPFTLPGTSAGSN